MPNLLEPFLWLPTLAAVVARVTGLMLAGPILGSRIMPRQLKVALTLAMSLLLLPLVGTNALPQVTLAQVVVGSVGELLIGVGIGLTFTAMASGVELAASLMGQQAGLSLAQVYDPTINDETTALGQLYSAVYVLCFLSIGGDRAMVRALLETFREVPLMRAAITLDCATMLSGVLNAAFTMGIRLAAPVMVSLLLVTLLLGILSRTMPQFNVLTIGFNFKVVVLLGVCALSLGSCGELVTSAIAASLEFAREFVVGLTDTG